MTAPLSLHLVGVVESTCLDCAHYVHRWPAFNAGECWRPTLLHRQYCPECNREAQLRRPVGKRLRCPACKTEYRSRPLGYWPATGAACNRFKPLSSTETPAHREACDVDQLPLARSEARGS